MLPRKKKKKLHNVLWGKITQSKRKQKGRGHVQTVLVLEKTQRWQKCRADFMCRYLEYNVAAA